MELCATAGTGHNNKLGICTFPGIGTDALGVCTFVRITLNNFKVCICCTWEKYIRGSLHYWVQIVCTDVLGTGALVLYTCYSRDIRSTFAV